MPNYNRIRNDSLKSITNTFLYLVKKKANIELSVFERDNIIKELNSVIGSIEYDNIKYSYELKRAVKHLRILDKYRINHKDDNILLSEYFQRYFIEAIKLENETLNLKLKK